jgi:hypothetical protein
LNSEEFAKLIKAQNDNALLAVKQKMKGDANEGQTLPPAEQVKD